MTRSTLPLATAAAALAIAIVPAGASAAEVQLQAAGPVIELAVTESVAAEPDVVNLDAGVTTFALTATEAMQQNADAMTRVIDRIDALGVARRDIQTSGISLNPEYEWDEGTRSQRFRGYRVMNRVTIKLRDIDATGAALDALVASGATDLGGVAFAIDDPEAARGQARAAAVAAANERALGYARMAGYSGVRLLEISETMGPGYPVPMLRTMNVQAEHAASTPVRPGQVEASVTVSVKYEMTR
jgi:uncharacterized protein